MNIYLCLNWPYPIHRDLYNFYESRKYHKIHNNKHFLSCKSIRGKFSPISCYKLGIRWSTQLYDELIFKIKCRQASKHFKPVAIAKDIATCHVTLFGWRIRGRARGVRRETDPPKYGNYMTSSALIVPLYFRYCTIMVHILCNTTLLAMETAVHSAFIITEPHLSFNWPLKHTGEIDPILVTLTCLLVNRTPVVNIPIYSPFLFYYL